MTRINNKKRNLMKYRYCKRDTSEALFYADDRVYFTLIPIHRQKANQIKQKFGISQRWAVCFKQNRNGTVEVYKWARYKGYYIAKYVEMFNTTPFCLAKSEMKGEL